MSRPWSLLLTEVRSTLRLDALVMLGDLSQACPYLPLIGRKVHLLKSSIHLRPIY